MDHETHERILPKEGPGMTCSAEYLGEKVRVSDWEKVKKQKGRQPRTEQTLATMDQGR